MADSILNTVKNVCVYRQQCHQLFVFFFSDDLSDMDNSLLIMSCLWSALSHVIFQ